MVDNAAGDSAIKRLHTLVNSELVQALASEDPDSVPDTERQRTVAVLRNLQGAVVALETYEDTLGEA